MSVFQFLKITCLFVITEAVWAGNLLQIHDLAQAHNPGLKAEFHRYQALKEAVPQARSALFPSLHASSTWNKSQYRKPQKIRSKSEILGVALQQDLFNYAAVENYKAAQYQDRAGFYDLKDYQDAFRMNVTSTYFNVLGALAQKEFTEQQLKAYQKSLDQAIARNSAGVNTIVEVKEAQAKYDAAYSQEIAAQNQVETSKTELSQLLATGQMIDKISDLSPKFETNCLKKQTLDHWLGLFQSQNKKLLSSKALIESAKHDWFSKKSGHAPTVALSGSLNHGTTAHLTQPRQNFNTIGLTVSLPLFSAGRSSSLIAQAHDQLSQAMYQYDSLKANTESLIKKAFFSLKTHESQIQALKQAIASNKSALDATSAAYEAGTRTMLDVLAAQTTLLKNQHDYKAVRYNYILEYLNLKYLSGSISHGDIIEINQYLEGAA